MNNQSAVIVLHEQATDSLLLTKRTYTLREHPGEFCFPGGGRDEQDFDLWSTALRELQEELGIDDSRVELIQALKPEHTLVGKVIYPWLASISQIDPFTINKNEVSEVITLPMADVRNIVNYKDITIKRQGISFVSCQYTASRQFVWGATARIMKQLCNVKD